MNEIISLKHSRICNLFFTVQSIFSLYIQVAVSVRIQVWYQMVEGPQIMAHFQFTPMLGIDVILDMNSLVHLI